jgi:predicted aldo/keto reductase-like oxidoreductase
MIPQQEFGRTGHQSTRAIFGSWALRKASLGEANRALALLQKHGVNHIDTAPMYGNAEKLIGPWLTKHREHFFVATKTRSRSRQGALASLERSLQLLRVDYIDLWQMHGLTNPAGWAKAMGPDGALEAFVEARDKGLVRFLGVTGHGTTVPTMHKRGLERFAFDSVLLPYNYLLMANPGYASAFNELVSLCRQRNVAVQTIKSIARWPCRGASKRYNTYFYEPLDAQDAIDKNVHWALGLPDSFLITVGDLQLLPKVLEAASSFETRPSDEEMRDLADKFAMQQIFPNAPRSARGKGPQTWGGRVCRAIEGLMCEGFFRYPEGRRLEQVVEALAFQGLSVEGQEDKVAGFLERRARKGILKKSRGPEGRVYWTD